MRLAKALKILRRKTFMTQERFAEELCVNVSTINRWEHEKSRPNLTAMKNIKLYCEKNGQKYDLVEKAWLKERN